MASVLKRIYNKYFSFLSGGRKFSEEDVDFEKMGDAIQDPQFERMTETTGVQEDVNESLVIQDDDTEQMNIENTQSEAFKYSFETTEPKNKSGIDGIGIYTFTDKDVTNDVLMLSNNCIFKLQFSPEIKSAPTIALLDVSNNSISEDIAIFSVLESLEHLDISSNKFYGNLDELLLSSLPNLSTFNGDVNNMRFSQNEIDFSETELTRFSAMDNALDSVEYLSFPKKIEFINIMENPKLLQNIKTVWVFENVRKLADDASRKLKTDMGEMTDTIREYTEDGENGPENRKIVEMIERNANALIPRQDDDYDPINYEREIVLNSLIIQKTHFEGHVVRCESDEKTVRDIYPVVFSNITVENALQATIIKDLEIMDDYGRFFRSRRPDQEGYWKINFQAIPAERKSVGVLFS